LVGGTDWFTLFTNAGGWNRSTPGFMDIDALLTKMKMLVDSEYRVAFANAFRMCSEKDHELLLGYTLQFTNKPDALDEAVEHMEQSRLAYMQVVQDTKKQMTEEFAHAEQWLFFNNFKEQVYFQGIW